MSATRSASARIIHRREEGASRMILGSYLPEETPRAQACAAVSEEDPFRRLRTAPRDITRQQRRLRGGADRQADGIRRGVNLRSKSAPRRDLSHGRTAGSEDIRLDRLTDDGRLGALDARACDGRDREVPGTRRQVLDHIGLEPDACELDGVTQTSGTGAVVNAVAREIGERGAV